jgi:hypothetical protein
MDGKTDVRHDQPVHQGDYEPPKVECVLTAHELAREVQYAGVNSIR